MRPRFTAKSGLAILATLGALACGFGRAEAATVIVRNPKGTVLGDPMYIYSFDIYLAGGYGLVEGTSFLTLQGLPDIVPYTSGHPATYAISWFANPTLDLILALDTPQDPQGVHVVPDGTYTFPNGGPTVPTASVTLKSWNSTHGFNTIPVQSTDVLLGNFTIQMTIDDPNIPDQPGNIPIVYVGTATDADGHPVSGPPTPIEIVFVPEPSSIVLMTGTLLILPGAFRLHRRRRAVA